MSIDELTQLKITYQSELPAKASAIEACCKSIVDALKGQEAVQWKQLEHLVHKLAGSSGTYGFGALAQLCRNFEDELCDGVIQSLSPPKAIARIESWCTEFCGAIQNALKQDAGRSAA